MSGYRLTSGGRIDRSRPLNFTFDGRAMQGFAGDTLASAMLANGVGTLGRSFKYHRPRGIYAAGIEDPNAMLEVVDGHGREPALRAGQVQLVEGLQVRSVTGWPSPQFDLASLATRLASPFMTAGFYYKTLKWPNWSWYEEAIRKAAGFGAPDGSVDARGREYRHASCDVLVIGAGPAGLAALRSLQGSGREVVLVDHAPVAGGALRWEDARIDGQDGMAWADKVVADCRADGGKVLLNTFVTGAYEGNFFTLIESFVDGAGLRAERIWKLRARQVVMATGSVDRPLVCQNNDRPGVLLSASVRQFIGEYGVAPGKRLAVFTNNDSGYLTALRAIQAGIEAPVLIDTRARPSAAHLEAARAAGVQIHLQAQISDIQGGKAVRSLRVIDHAGAEQRISCDALALAGGATPMIHLAAHRGARPVYDEESSSFICTSLPQGWHGAGAATGARELSDVLVQGHAAGQAIAATGRDAPLADVPLGMGEVVPMWQAATGSPKKMFVDLQNDVKASDVQLAARENYVSVEHLKRYTTLGMGTDQGRTSNINGLAIMAAATGREVAKVGTTTFRPPYTATRMGAIAHHRQEDGYAPRRLMPAHGAHVALAAQFEDFGWQRPDWYECNGADREAAVRTEMQAVRNAVGVFDASPLGKVEVVGPDAREFINKFYVSNLATLKPGRIRYSVMCHDDGIIFDDGVVACVDDNFFLAGPTSGNAETVAAWFERWRQTEWPGMAVAIAPVTSNWAAIALAGPKARDLLARLGPDFDISGEAFAHMQFREGSIGGVPARVARVSFTGELQYEIAVPARYGHALMQAALREGADLGATGIGMEAWLRLRLEKGYLHLGADTNGRTTPLDIGMGGVVKKKAADFIGKRALSLPFNALENREELVGLKPVDVPIRIGARILAEGHDQIPCPTIGNVTSVCDSPLAGNIAMGLVEGGSKRMGQRVKLYAEGRVSEAEICSPVFVDPKNERLHA
ncbi:2Fe-2S iron-sulfur cluster-binding protein [Paracoccus seriniphilus]|uniref:2Fe-2S iron-sulfur cluster-binding protein n=1 Tax=Paracoccus seriniphilus TaxID=184748 RepID=UPI00356955D8